MALLSRRNLCTKMLVLSTSIVIIVTLSSFISVTKNRTRTVQTRAATNSVFGSSWCEWPTSRTTAIDHSHCPLDKHFKLFLYNHHYPQYFQRYSLTRESLLKSLESSLKQKQMWATGPEEACAFLVVLRPFLQIALSSSINDTANLLSSLPYWSYHGSEGRNHIVVDLLESSQRGSVLLSKAVYATSAIVVSNYVTQAGGIFAPPIPPETAVVEQSQDKQTENVYADIEQVFATVNTSSDYSSILPLHREYTFYFEGNYVELDEQDLYKVNSLLSLIQKEAYILSDSNYFRLSSHCIPNSIPAWNEEWRLCGSEKSRLRLCKEAKFSLILGPLNSEEKLGPTTYLRLIESLKCGSVPVIIGLGKLPFDDVIDWQKSALAFPWQLWKDALQTAAAMSVDMMMEYRRQGKFLLHTYFSDAGLVLDSIVAIVRKKFLHPPPLAQDSISTLLLTNGRESQQHNINKDTTQYVNYALNMGDRIWNSPPGPHFIYPVTPFRPISFHNQVEARQMPLPDSIRALRKSVDEIQVQKFMKMHRLSVLKQISDAKADSSQSLGGHGSMYHIPKSTAIKKSQSVGKRGAAKYLYSKISEMYTIITLTHHRDDQIVKQIRFLERCPFLHKIIIVWNNAYPIPESMSLPDARILIEVVSTGVNSLNNRFLPLSNIETEAVLTLDDDIGLSCDDIELGFRIWRENRDVIVGWTSRVHGKDLGGRWSYSFARVCERSMVITNAAFFHKYYSYLYSFWMPAEIRDIVDRLMNCEDIAMNFLVSYITGKAQVKVGKKRAIQTENNCKEDVQSGLSCDSSSHFLERDFCLATFAESYGYVPLIYSVARTEPLYVKSSSRMDWCDKYRDES